MRACTHRTHCMHRTNAANEYLVAARSHSLATAAWDDIPFDNQLMIHRYVYEQERADRYRARALRFEFRGFIAQADRQELLQALEAWLTLRANLPTSFQQVEQHAQQQAAIRRRLETRLRAVFDSVFRCWDFFDGPDELNSDELNLSDEAWAQVALHVQRLLPEVETPDHRQAAEIRATSADGLHRLRLRFCQLPLHGPPYTCVNIRYYGPQRFRTFDNWHYAAARGGLVQECRGSTQHPDTQHPEALDDPRVFEDWRAVA
jgi:hypothetical protein